MMKIKKLNICTKYGKALIKVARHYGLDITPFKINGITGLLYVFTISEYDTKYKGNYHNFLEEKYPYLVPFDDMNTELECTITNINTCRLYMQEINKIIEKIRKENLIKNKRK